MSRGNAATERRLVDVAQLIRTDVSSSSGPAQASVLRRAGAHAARVIGLDPSAQMQRRRGDVVLI